MTGLVKNVFLLIMGSTVAYVLYFILFGYIGWNGQHMDIDMASTGYRSMARWKGALWYAAEMVETPISRYYYMCCYLPNIHMNDYVDENLGGTLKEGNIFKTPTDLKSTDSDLMNFSHTTKYFSTGWR